MKRLGNPALSPDGRFAIVPVSEPAYDDARKSSDLWLVATDGSAPPRRLTFSTASESNPAWSPDSRRIAFAAKREGQDETQIYVLDIARGGEAERVTEVGDRREPAAVAARRRSDPVRQHDFSRRRGRRGEPAAARGAQGAQVQRPRLRRLPDPPLGSLARRAAPDTDAADARARRAAPVDLLAGTELAKNPGFGGNLDNEGETAGRRLVAGRQRNRVHRDDRARPGRARRRPAVAVRDPRRRRRAAPAHRRRRQLFEARLRAGRLGALRAPAAANAFRLQRRTPGALRLGEHDAAAGRIRFPPLGRRFRGDARWRAHLPAGGRRRPRPAVRRARHRWRGAGGRQARSWLAGGAPGRRRRATRP